MLLFVSLSALFDPGNLDIISTNCLWKHVQCWSHAHTHVAVAAVASVSAVAAARGLALCPWYHPAWVSVGTPVGPGQDTHGTLGPDQREGRGWPVHSSTQQYRVQYRRHTAQKHGKHGNGAMSIQGKNVGRKSTVDESMLCYDGPKKWRTHWVDSRGLPGACGL